MEKKKCVKCQEGSLFWMEFTALKDNPVICERCFFEVLTGERRTHNDMAVKAFDEYRKKK